MDTLPASPGVYLMKDHRNRPIYIGKAKSLRSRVRSYFQDSREIQPRLRAMVAKIVDLEAIVTDSEMEALILEANLIKHHKPRYNVNLKDDKRYPLIKVTVKDPFPRVMVVRVPQKDGSKYFGPYTNAKSMRWTLRTLRQIFPVRSCAHRLPRDGVKVCLDYHINRCLGVCQGFASQEEYRRVIDGVILFLSGRNHELENQLREQMEQAADAMNFELAARLRDRLHAVERVVERQKIVTQDDVDRDVISFARKKKDACVVVLQIRGGVLVSRQHYALRGTEGSDDREVVTAFVKGYYLNSPTIPDEICLPLEVEEQGLVEDWLKRQRGGKVRVTVPKRGQKASLLSMAAQNARLLVEEMLMEKKLQRERLPQSVAALQRDLYLPRPPRVIEAFDISTLGGKDAVGSLVRFVDARPQKSGYRRFKIKTVDGQDDFAMMREVVSRRFKRLLAEERSFPDLVLVDGGKGQLSSALSALRQLGGRELPVIGLAKRLDEVFLPGRADSLMIPKASSSLRLIQRIRDEAHRFAVAYHRDIRGKRTLRSELSEIRGVGEARERALLRRFGSVNGVRKARVDELQKTQGINKPVAQAIFEHFHKNDAEN